MHSTILYVETHPWATAGFFKICWPNLSVLNNGFLTALESSEDLGVDFAFADGWCAREKRSVVARGMLNE